MISWSGVATGYLMSRKSFGQDQRVSCCDRIFLCHDKFGQARSFLSRHNILCRDLRNSMSRHSLLGCEDFLSRLSIFMSRQSWPRQGEIM